MQRAIVAIVVIAVIAVGAFALTGKKAAAPSSTDNKSTQNSQSQSKSAAPASTPQSGNVAVTIKDFDFSPMNITVKKGTKVTWTNQDSVRHNVVSDSGNGGPNGPLLGKGESYSFTFDTVGTFAYHCDPHPYMKATVTVTE